MYLILGGGEAVAVGRYAAAGMPGDAHLNSVGLFGGGMTAVTVRQKPGKGANQCVIWNKRFAGSGRLGPGVVRSFQRGGSGIGGICPSDKVRLSEVLDSPDFRVSKPRLSREIPGGSEISRRSLTGWVCVKKRAEWRVLCNVNAGGGGRGPQTAARTLGLHGDK